MGCFSNFRTKNHISLIIYLDFLVAKVRIESYSYHFEIHYIVKEIGLQQDNRVKYRFLLFPTVSEPGLAYLIHFSPIPMQASLEAKDY